LPIPRPKSGRGYNWAGIQTCPTDCALFTVHSQPLTGLETLRISTELASQAAFFVFDASATIGAHGDGGDAGLVVFGDFDFGFGLGFDLDRAFGFG